VNEIEQRLGNPWDDGNPLGYRAVLAADERATVPAAGERMLDEYGLGAELVPPDLGGRLDRLDRLIQLLRAIARRDLALTLASSAPLFAAVNVWTAGSAQQRRRAAQLLLDNRKLSAGYHELAHGNDFSAVEFAARRTAGGWLLNGRKEVISNLHSASAVVLFARTSDAAGSRSHSLLFLDKSTVDIDASCYLPRFRTEGLRGVQLGGFELRDLPLGPESVLGVEGHGIETALRSFQITRIALPGTAVGVVDTGLRVAMRFATERRLYGRTAADLPLVQASLTDAFVELLICDCLTTVAARAVHLLPGQTSVYAAAAKAFVPAVLRDAMYRLSLVLGAHFYVRDGRYAIFGKHLRDLPAHTFGHAGRAACQLTMLPQLLMLGRRSWLTGEPAPAALFQLAEALPPLRYDQLALTSSADPLAASLCAGLDAVADPAVRAACAPFVAALQELKVQVSALAPRDVGPAASPAAFALTARYAAVLAASACLNVWRHSGGGFLADPAWLLAALRRLAARIGQPVTDPVVDQALHAELGARFAQSRSFDLAAQPVAG
jgi:alkylation response protein AidB-like acyl-CoA dehydrogenase